MYSCPSCQTAFKEGTKFCQNCGCNLAEELRSNAQYPWRILLFSFLTFGLYQFYWFYRNWKHLKTYKKLNISPVWRTVGLLVPFYGIVLVYEQFRDIRDIAQQVGYKKLSLGWLLTGYLVSNALSFILSGLSTIFVLLCIMAISAILMAFQKALNHLWAKEQPSLQKRNDFSRGEIIIISIGSILWLLLIAGAFFQGRENQTTSVESSQNFIPVKSTPEALSTETSTDDEKEAWSCPYSHDQIKEKIERIRQLISKQNNSYRRNIDIAFEYEIQMQRLEKITTTLGCDNSNIISNQMDDFKKIYGRISERQSRAAEEIGKALRDSGINAINSFSGK